MSGAQVPRIGSLLIKPVSALCQLDCAYCFYLDRESDPYAALTGRRMSLETLEHLVDTYLFYSYPQATLAFQGGEPMLAGRPFFEHLMELEKRCGRDGQSVSNAIQTNGLLIDDTWCELFKRYQWLVGLSLDGPPEIHDANRRDRAGHGTGERVLASLECLRRNQVEFNVLCVLSAANVDKPRELYRYFRSLGVEHIQYIPLSDRPFAIAPEQYGRFLCETFALWWPERRRVRIRLFDNLAEALAGRVPGNCALHELCHSYALVEYNGDVYPCDFFVREEWKLGNLMVDSWPELARRRKRAEFAAKKAISTPECLACEYASVCHGGCPKHRYDANGRFEDQDYFCAAYKMLFARAFGPLKQDLVRLGIH